jgi:hypothetical protein
LYFLSPAIGELLSGSAPPAEFFHPFGLLVMSALYGSGAILARELALRWRRRWPSILALGAAYGILEEGVMVKSFFDPNWMDLGVLGEYGRWAGVNWVWSLQLTIYHAIFSIAIPILLVELLFPARRDGLWIGRRGMIGLSLLLMADVLFGYFVLNPYRPPAGPYLLALGAVVALYRLARRLPAHLWRLEEGAVSPPRAFFLLGLGGTIAFFGIHWGLPASGLPVSLTMLASIGLAFVVMWTIRHLSRAGAWQDRHRLALASGALMFFVLLAPLQEFDNTRSDNTSGMMLVALATLIFLFWSWRRVRRAEIEQDT